MKPLPTADLRSNLGTWAVKTSQLAAVAHFMHDALPNEDYDPRFYGQALATTYFDTRKFELRKNRNKHKKYITLRVRQYTNSDGVTYALSAKTEASKFRLEINLETALKLCSGIGADRASLASTLPTDLFTRLLDVAHGDDVFPVVTVNCRRYAIEDERQRFTLDTDIRTDLGKRLPYAIIEFKSTDDNDTPPDSLKRLGLQPTKLSKFLWATTR